MYIVDVDKIHPLSEKICSHDRLKSPTSAFRINPVSVYTMYTLIPTHITFLSLKWYQLPNILHLSSNVVFRVHKSIPSFRDSVAKKTIILWNKVVVLVIFPLQDIYAFFSLHQG